MSIDDEVVVRRVFVLAHASLEERRVFHPRKAIGKVASRLSQTVVVDQSLSEGRIELAPTGIVRQFEAAVLVPGNSVHKVVAVIRPDRQVAFVIAVVTRWSSEEQHILLGGYEVRAYSPRKQLAEPRPTGENIAVGEQLRSVRELRTLPIVIFNPLPRNRCLQVFASLGNKMIDHRLRRSAGQQVAAVRLPDPPFHFVEIELLPPP